MQMFTIKVYSEDEALLKYLGYEGTKINEDEFEFTSADRVVDVMTRYIFFEIKQGALKNLFPSTEDDNSEIESFLMFIPHEYEEMWRKRIREIVDEYINSEEVKEFYIDGFMMFRMNDIKNKYLKYLTEEYECFSDATEPTETLESLIDFMDAQPFKAEEIIIETQENGDILIKEDDICLFLETENEQENIVVQSIYASPRKLKVIDEHDILRKELVIVLKQIFGHNLIFERNKKTN